LAQYHRTLDDLPEALRLIQALSALPTPWDWATVRAALHNVAFFLRAGIAPEHINQVLAEHRRLAEMGFDESTAVAVAEPLTRQKALGPQRAEVLQEMAAGALAKVDVQALNKERGRLTAEIRTLEITEQQLSESVTTMSRRLDDLQKREAEAQQRLTQLEREWTSKTEDLDVLRALRAFLLRKTGAVEAFFIDLDRVRQYRKQGRAPADYAALHLDEVRQQLLGFIQRLVTEDQNGEGTTDL
jgi:chromosome segregation ATPase